MWGGVNLMALTEVAGPGDGHDEGKQVDDSERLL